MTIKIALVLGLVVLAFPVGNCCAPVGYAQAQEGDDGGGGDGGDGGGDDGGDDGGNDGAGSGFGGDDGGDGAGGGGGGVFGGGSAGGRDNPLERLFGGFERQRGNASSGGARSRSAQRAADRRESPRPESQSGVIVARGLEPNQQAELERLGYSVLDEVFLGTTFGERVVRLQVPRGRSLERAKADVEAQAAIGAADLNHFYRNNSDGNGNSDGACVGPQCLPLSMIGWPLEGSVPRQCGMPMTIGMVDTAINPDHESLAGGSIEMLDAVPQSYRERGLAASGRGHGTAVAALLIGSAQSRTPGLLPNHKLVAVDAFHRAGQDERSDVYTLVRALDMLAERGAKVINVSLAGPANNLLEEAVKRLTEKGITIVAAAGNNGPKAAPAYPAGYPGVLAVTAVDTGKNVFRRANQGEYIDFAAPGVDIWTAASVRGGKPKTGTSFAVPFITAAAALAIASDPDAGSEEIIAALAPHAEDLGPEGSDPVYGRGLVKVGALCQSEVTAAGD
jgi:hypothetical protein